MGWREGQSLMNTNKIVTITAILWLKPLSDQISMSQMFMTTVQPSDPDLHGFKFVVSIDRLWQIKCSSKP
jgi:hypothetical protein